MTKHIKIVCLNLWWGGELFDAIIEFLQQEQPDILLLQEVFDGRDPGLAGQYRSMEVLRSRFPFVADDFAATFCEAGDVPERGVERGNAIFSKYPITQRFKPIFFNEPYSDAYVDADPVNNPKAPRNLQHIQVDIDGVVANLYNFQGVWDLDGESDSPERLQMSKKIVDAISGEQNVILAGDTNVRPNTKTIRNIETHLTNVFTDELNTTFNMRRKDNPGYATSVVDMLFVSPNFTVIEHHCPDVDISDHLPLVATVELPTEK